MSKNIHCSFCGKYQNEVKRLIAGPTVYICNECVSLSTEIIEYKKWRKIFLDDLSKEGKVLIDVASLNTEKQKEFKKPDTSLTRFEAFFKRNAEKETGKI